MKTQGVIDRNQCRRPRKEVRHVIHVCVTRTDAGPTILVLDDMTTLYSETEEGDEFPESGF